MTEERKQAEEINALLLEWELYKKAHWYKSDAIDVEAFLMYEFAKIKASIKVAEATKEMPTEEEARSTCNEWCIDNNEKLGFIACYKWFHNRMKGGEK